MSAGDLLDRILNHPGSWTEEDYFALGVTAFRIELFTGGLLVSPAPAPPHQDISHRLAAAVLPDARSAGLRARQAVAVRLAENRVVIPDFVVSRGARVTTVVEAADVVLLGEINSRGTGPAGQALREHYFAAAEVEFFLVVEPDPASFESLRLRLLRLEREAYVEHAVAEHGETLTADEPFPLSISTTELLDF
ncbi:Uma2 family endonuclease [Actinoplanes sp. NPDC023936]|uniref:Uma2 family endonuclease n=1 Tax=Actinoplanes sp. NPDC023936 TaxID=3154910 RepID=UPI0033C592F3